MRGGKHPPNYRRNHERDRINRTQCTTRGRHKPQATQANSRDRVHRPPDNQIEPPREPASRSWQGKRPGAGRSPGAPKTRTSQEHKGGKKREKKKEDERRKKRESAETLIQAAHCVTHRCKYKAEKYGESRQYRSCACEGGG